MTINGSAAHAPSRSAPLQRAPAAQPSTFCSLHTSSHRGALRPTRFSQTNTFVCSMKRKHSCRTLRPTFHSVTFTCAPCAAWSRSSNARNARSWANHVRKAPARFPTRASASKAPRPKRRTPTRLRAGAIATVPHPCGAPSTNVTRRAARTSTTPGSGVAKRIAWSFTTSSHSLAEVLVQPKI